MNKPLLFSMISAFCFGFWPVISRFSRLGAPQVGIFVSLGTAMMVITGMMAPASKLPWTLKSSCLCLAAGLLNGIGILAYSRLVSEPSWDLSRYIPTVFGLTVAIATMSGVIFFGETLPLQKLTGVALIIIAICLLR